MGKRKLKSAASVAGAAGTPKPMPAGLARPVMPSAELAAIVGAEPRPRSAMTSRVWSYIKAHDLQAADDRRAIVADDALRPIIGERCGVFDLPGKIGPHLTAA